LQNGDPIYFDVQTLKIPADQTVGHVTIFAGETETELTRTLKSLIGPVTEVVTVPKGDPRPT
jgi:uncharacterized protein YaaW (UPF0174 family)